MGRFLNPDNIAFQVTLNSEIYVDKTDMIDIMNKSLGTMQAFICNSRPRRFGKSVTANMLAAYYSKGCDSRQIFSNLNIAKYEGYEENLNKYDVLHFDVQWLQQSTKNTENLVSYIENVILKELKESYLGENWNESMSLSEALSCIYTNTGNRFVVIIDEWDALIRDETVSAKVQNEYISFLRSIFKGTEPTKYIALAYLTGILPIKKIKTQSALNNFEEFTMLDSGNLAPYMGFTEQEVRGLAKQYSRDFEKIKQWYDGYCLGDYHVYNPKAVDSVMRSGKFRSYWSQTGTYESILPLINLDFDGLKTAILEMLSGSRISVWTGTFQNDMVSFCDKDDVLTLLIHLGYLAYDENQKSAFIPNEEIRQEFLSALKSKKWNRFLEFQEKSREILDNILEEENDFVAEKIEELHNRFASTIEYNNENSLSSVLTIALLSSMEFYFMPMRELPTGRGFADFIYLPKPEYKSLYPALVVELKWNKRAIAAIQQIKEKKYADSLKEYTGEILLVGINYDKKTKKHECLIERVVY